MKIVSKIPNTITLMNLVSGCVAVIMAFKFNEVTGGLPAWGWAMIWIGAAAVFDFLDGLAARTLHAYSELGKELDSLSDLVSFGVAPAMLMYNFLTLYTSASWMAYLVLLIPAMGALRLARFNIDERQHTSFIGLPIPANAIFWVGAVAWGLANVESLEEQVMVWILYIALVAIPLLMVSNLRMFSLKIKTFGWAENWRRYILILGCAGLVIAFGVQGLAWTILLYIALAVVCPQN